MRTKILAIITIFTLFLGFSLFLFVPAVKAVTPECDTTSFSYNLAECLKQGGATPKATPAAGKTGATVDCNNPFNSRYTSAECVQSRLGISDLKADQILVARDPNSLFVVVAQIFIWIAIVASVLRIAWKGIQIGGAGDDADKRKELFVAIIWTLVGLIVALGALGITYSVATLVFGKSFDDQIINCDELANNPNADADLIKRCQLVINGTNSGGTTTTPGGSNPF